MRCRCSPSAFQNNIVSLIKRGSQSQWDSPDGSTSSCCPVSLSSGKASSWARLAVILSLLLWVVHVSVPKLGMERGGDEIAYIEFGSTNGGLAPGPRPRRGIQEGWGVFPRHLINDGIGRGPRVASPFVGGETRAIVRKREEKEEPVCWYCLTRDLEGEWVDRLRGVEGGLGLISSRLIFRDHAHYPKRRSHPQQRERGNPQVRG